MGLEKDQTQEEIERQIIGEETIPQVGQVIKGTILEIDEKNGNVFIDINYKSEGILSISEFASPPRKGDVVEVFLIRLEGNDALSQVSKIKADEIRFKKNLRESMEVGQVIEGTIKNSTKGGFIVSLSYGVEAFLPASKADLYLSRDASSYVGLKGPFVISQFKIENNRNYNIVLDRRAYLKDQIVAKKEEFFKNYKVGDVVKGQVKEFVSFGAFIDLGGFDGLLHINDMSWRHASKPKEFVEKDQFLDLKIVHLDPEKGRINLSLKEMRADPWLNIRENFREGDVLQGEVTKLANFGAFVEISPDIEGLVHISEFSWTKKVNDPKEVVSVGQQLTVKVLEICEEKKRIALGVKQLHSNPWEKLESLYPVGKELELKVIRLLPSAAILEIEEGLDAYLPISELSWTQHYEKMGDVLKLDDRVKVKVIQVSAGDRSVRVSVRQLEANPWDKLKLGMEVLVSIKEKRESVWLGSLEDLEVLIPRSQIALSAMGTFKEADEKIDVGQQVQAIVQKLEPRKREVVVSLREYFKVKERGEISRYMASQTEESEGYNPFASLKTD